jgi:hypothetical protein
MAKGFRSETDPLGELDVPADAYYGVQTERAIRNFPISGRRPDIAPTPATPPPASSSAAQREYVPSRIPTSWPPPGCRHARAPGPPPCHQPPLPLIQMREQHPELPGQRLLHIHRNAHTTGT